MLGQVMIGLSLWIGTSVVAALVLGRILQRRRTFAGNHPALTHN